MVHINRFFVFKLYTYKIQNLRIVTLHLNEKYSVVVVVMTVVTQVKICVTHVVSVVPIIIVVFVMVNVVIYVHARDVVVVAAWFLIVVAVVMFHYVDGTAVMHHDLHVFMAVGIRVTEVTMPVIVRGTARRPAHVVRYAVADHMRQLVANGMSDTVAKPMTEPVSKSVTVVKVHL